MNKLVLAGAVVLAIVVLYLVINQNPDDDYQLDNYAACSLDSNCKSKRCCFLKGYSSKVCAPNESDCLHVSGEVCSCNDDTYEMSPCEGNCLSGLTCCETRSGWKCVNDPSSCLPSDGNVCRKEVGCRGDSKCCQQIEGGDFLCTPSGESDKCVGQGEGGGMYTGRRLQWRPQMLS